MSGLWGQLTHADGQAVAASFSRYRPRVGSIIRVVDGRKHAGKVGTVFYHGVDRYSRADRYGDAVSAAYRECAGRRGYRVGVETSDGEKFFVPADYTMVCVGSSS